MTDLPQRLSPGTRRLSVSWLNALRDAVASRTVQAGPGLRMSRTSGGTTLSAVPQRRVAAAADAASDVAVATITGGGGAGGYSAEILLADGTTARGTVFLPDAAPHQTLPIGTRVLVHPSSTASVVLRETSDESDGEGGE